MIVVRSMEHCIFPQRRRGDNKTQPPGHDSPFEEGVEGLLRFQGQQLHSFPTTAAPHSRRKGRRKWGQVRGPDSCHLDSLFKRLSCVFRCGRKTQLCQVLQASSFNRGVDDNRGWTRTCRFKDCLFNLDWREEGPFCDELETFGV